MHFEVPKGSLTSIKEFTGEYLMIVISIMTALALEHTAQSFYHAHLAQEANQKIIAEIRSNIKDIQDAQKKNKKSLNSLIGLGNLMREDIKAKLTDKEIMAHFNKESKGEFGLSLSIPTLRREAWEVSVANQSVSWMSPNDLALYSAAYTLQREMQSNLPLAMQSSLDGPRMADTLADLELDAASPRELYHVLMQMIQVSKQVYDNTKEMETELQKALPR